MGDRLKPAGKRRVVPVWREVNSQGVFDGVVAARHLVTPDGVHVLVGWHRFSGIPLCSWVVMPWDWNAMSEEWEGGVMSKFLKRLKETVNKGPGGPAAVDPEWSKKYPAIVEYMTLVQDDDKNERETSTLLIFAEAGVWKACLGDRETGYTLWASGGTVEELLESLEAILQSPRPGWRLKGKRLPKGKEGGK